MDIIALPNDTIFPFEGQFATRGKQQIIQGYNAEKKISKE